VRAQTSALCIFCGGLFVGNLLPLCEEYVRDQLFGKDIYGRPESPSIHVGMWISTFLFGLFLGALLVRTRYIAV
jgi:hypothetical protein